MEFNYDGGGLAKGGSASFAQEADPVREAGRQMKIVHRQDDRHAGAGLGAKQFKQAQLMGRVEAGKVLIDAGADVNQTDSTGSPPLTRLVMQCDATELVRAFIDAGADLSVELAGHTTLHQMAELGGCTENAKVLKAAGAK